MRFDGQTVVSSLNAPSLFLIAKDLGRMKVWASVNEADVNQVRMGQTVRFTVDGEPGRASMGELEAISDQAASLCVIAGPLSTCWARGSAWASEFNSRTISPFNNCSILTSASAGNRPSTTRWSYVNRMVTCPRASIAP